MQPRTPDPSPIEDDEDDAIMAEVRRAKEEVWMECGGDWDRFFATFRAGTEAARRAGWTIIDKPLREPDAA